MRPPWSAGRGAAFPANSSVERFGWASVTRRLRGRGQDAALSDREVRTSPAEDSKDFRVRRLREARIGHAAARAVFFALHIYVMAVLCTFPEVLGCALRCDTAAPRHAPLTARCLSTPQSPIRMGLIGKRQHTAYDDPTTPVRPRP